MRFVTIFGSARNEPASPWRNKAKELGFCLAKAGFGVITGGAGGIMSAANEGAFKAGGVSLGYNIRLPFEQRANPFCSQTLLFDNFSNRKGKLIEESEFFVVFPGGFGTLDELGDVLVLASTGLKKCQIILFDGHFWAPLLNFFENTLLADGFISKQSYDDIKICDSVESVLEFIKK